MAEPHLDHPGEISWFAGKGPLPVVGNCPHEQCQHCDAGTVAWGPDWDHYELVECLGCRCRGWWAEWLDNGRPRYRPPTVWLELERTPAAAR